MKVLITIGLNAVVSLLKHVQEPRWLIRRHVSVKKYTSISPASLQSYDDESA
jgi:hypothetical protein